MHLESIIVKGAKKMLGCSSRYVIKLLDGTWIRYPISKELQA